MSRNMAASEIFEAIFTKKFESWKISSFEGFLEYINIFEHCYRILFKFSWIE